MIGIFIEGDDIVKIYSFVYNSEGITKLWHLRKLLRKIILNFKHKNIISVLSFESQYFEKLLVKEWMR